MKHIFLTSSPFPGIGEPLNEQNRFAERLSVCLHGTDRALFIASDPSDTVSADYFADETRHSLALSGIVMNSFSVLDIRNHAQTKELVSACGFIILAGGHVPTQNAFFSEIRLRDCLTDFSGTVLGISAGSMNAADSVYAQPEEPGEADNPAYQRFLKGLGLTKTMLIPHYQEIKDSILDGKRLFEDITYPDSIGRQFVALCDGSYLESDGVQERICGEAYQIRDGMIRQLCAEHEEYILQ